MFAASAVLNNEKVHVMAGAALMMIYLTLYMFIAFPPTTGIHYHPLDTLVVYYK